MLKKVLLGAVAAATLAGGIASAGVNDNYRVTNNGAYTLFVNEKNADGVILDRHTLNVGQSVATKGGADIELVYFTGEWTSTGNAYSGIFFKADPSFGIPAGKPGSLDRDYTYNVSTHGSTFYAWSQINNRSPQ